LETELKLLINPKHADLLRKNALLHQAGSEPVVQRLLSTYYDTAERFLQRHGASLRVRQVEGEGWLQTVKGKDSSSGGLHRRDEWETPLPGPTPDVKAALEQAGHDPHWSHLLSSKDLQTRLTPLFTTEMERTSWILHLPRGDVVEVALDLGRVRHENGEVVINELELELKEGEPVHLFDFALALHAAVPKAELKIGNKSKAQRGFSLVVPDQPAATKAQPIALDATISCSHALREILLNCLRQVEANADGVSDGHDPECVHQMRVGLRRLHSALSLFRRLAPLPAALEAGFAALRHALGDARDADVLAGSTLPTLASQFSSSFRTSAQAEDAFSLLQEAASLRSRERRAVAAKAVAAPDTTRLLLGFSAWAIGERWRDGATAEVLAKLDAPVRDFARKTLRRKRKALLQRARGLSRLSGTKQHQVRIAAKKLRYASEFFCSLPKDGKEKRSVQNDFQRRLSQLQDELGFRNDLRVAEGLLVDVAAGGSAPLVEAAGFARGCLSERSTRGKRRLMRRWKIFRKAAVPRIARASHARDTPAPGDTNVTSTDTDVNAKGN
jgi:triphosphatase